MVSVEDRLSGNGFMEWARRWQAEGRIMLPGGQEMDADADARVVLARPHSEWSALREAYSRLLGVVLGDLAMAATVPGGIHLIGGFAEAIFPHLDMAEFERGFCESRRLRISVENVDVSVVVDQRNPALLGAVAIGQGRVVVGG
jgi:glucokinase